MKIVGIDLSLTSTGIAVAECVEGKSPKMTNQTIITKSKKYKTLQPRLCFILNHIKTLCVNVDFVVIEGYSFGSKSPGFADRCELAGIVKYWLWTKSIRYTLVAPTTLKKFATGNGGAGKEEMIAVAAADLGIFCKTNDEADAVWLREMGLVHHGLSKLRKLHLPLEIV